MSTLDFTWSLKKSSSTVDIKFLYAINLFQANVVIS